jgi:Ni/Fe-hydrogenase subunit HybB-like protein
MERRMNTYTKRPASRVRLALHPDHRHRPHLRLLPARQAYGSALLPPMFIVLSFAWGLAVFHLVQANLYAWNDNILDPAILQRKKNLLGVFIIGSLYMVAVYHLTNLYFAQQTGFERFILRDGGIYPTLFWWGTSPSETSCRWH